jgi:hypothetical protein
MDTTLLLEDWPLKADDPLALSRLLGIPGLAVQAVE